MKKIPNPFLNQERIFFGATHVDIGSASRFGLQNFIIITSFASKWNYQIKVYLLTHVDITVSYIVKTTKLHKKAPLAPCGRG